MYVTKRCGYCGRAKNFFKANGVDYQAIDIDKSSEGRKQFKALGGKGVPLIIIGDHKIRGYNQQAIKRALGI